MAVWTTEDNPNAGKFGSENTNWKGDDVGYFTRHNRVKNQRGSASCYSCYFCDGSACDWAQLHDTDGLSVYEDYVPACRSCHLVYDRTDENNGHANRTQYAHGDGHPHAKLTEEKVLEIRKRAANGEEYAFLAKEFDVTVNCIRLIVNRQRWRHI